MDCRIERRQLFFDRDRRHGPACCGSCNGIGSRSCVVIVLIQSRCECWRDIIIIPIGLSRIIGKHDIVKISTTVVVRFVVASTTAIACVSRPFFCVLRRAVDTVRWWRSASRGTVWFHCWLNQISNFQDSSKACNVIDDVPTNLVMPITLLFRACFWLCDAMVFCPGWSLQYCCTSVFWKKIKRRQVYTIKIPDSY